MNNIYKSGAGETVQQLRVLAAFTGHPSLVHSSLQPPITPIPGDPTPSSGPCE